MLPVRGVGGDILDNPGPLAQALVLGADEGGLTVVEVVAFLAIWGLHADGDPDADDLTDFGLLLGVDELALVLDFLPLLVSLPLGLTLVILVPLPTPGLPLGLIGGK